jgi:major membrane immunogen (membrane-anchored lipoprotein)
MRIDLANKIIKNQSTIDVDSIVGATVTTRNWINLVNQALDQAKQDNNN